MFIPWFRSHDSSSQLAFLYLFHESFCVFSEQTNFLFLSLFACGLHIAVPVSLLLSGQVLSKPYQQPRIPIPNYRERKSDWLAWDLNLLCCNFQWQWGLSLLQFCNSSSEIWGSRNVSDLTSFQILK